MIRSNALFLAVAMCFTSVVTAQNPTPAKPPASHEKAAEKKETFAVVASGEDFKVMPQSAVDALKKDKQAAFDKANAEHAKAKKDAEAAKKPFDAKAPKLEVVDVKKDGFATEALAKAHVEELMKAKKEAAAKKDGEHKK